MLSVHRHDGAAAVRVGDDVALRPRGRAVIVALVEQAGEPGGVDAIQDAARVGVAGVHLRRHLRQP